MKCHLFLATALCLASTAGWAQTETGTRIGGRPAKVPTTGSNTERARTWLQGYAGCIAKRDPKRVADVLEADIGDESKVSRLVVGNFDDCLSTGGGADQLVMSPRVLRGALYAERVTKMVGELPAGMSKSPPLNLPPLSTLNAADQNRYALVRFGECVMRADPVNALAFVRADAGNAAESKALKTLSPLLGGCLDEGVQVELSKPILESALAEAIYRYARTAEEAK
jgi:hypothetical protein